MAILLKQISADTARSMSMISKKCNKLKAKTKAKKRQQNSRRNNHGNNYRHKPNVMGTVEPYVLITTAEDRPSLTDDLYESNIGTDYKSDVDHSTTFRVTYGLSMPNQ